MNTSSQAMSVPNITIDTSYSNSQPVPSPSSPTVSNNLNNLPTTPTARNPSFNVSILRLKLLDALRVGDNEKISSIISDLNENLQNSVSTTSLIQLRETILHFAVQISPLSCLTYLVNHPKYNLDINSQDKDGNTPLHLAVLSSRMDVVKYLLSLPNINDTIVNINLKQPVELCKDLEIAQIMQVERAKFIESSANKLRQYFNNRDFKKLTALLNCPRVAELLDINGTDPQTGNTVLTEFIIKNDSEMVNWILNNGGDPFKRDLKGKLPIDHCTTDSIRKLIKLATSEQNILDPVINNQAKGGPPTHKGYLRKWTNFASGYKLRYFILDSNGILSYYTNEEDIQNSCRGSINLKLAKLHLDSSEKLKFEILGNNNIRWHLKGNHSNETNRWVWTLQNAISISKDSAKQKSGKVPNSKQSPIISSNPTNNTVNTTGTVKRSDTNGSNTSKSSFRAKSFDKIRSIASLNPPKRKHQRNSSNISMQSTKKSTSIDSSILDNEPNQSFTKESRINTPIIPNSSINGINAPTDDVETFEDFDNDDDYSSVENSEINSRDNHQQILVLQKSIEVELTSLIDLFKSVNVSHSNAANVSGNSSSLSATSGSMSSEITPNLSVGNTNNDEIFKISVDTLATISNMISKYNNLVQLNELASSKNLERQFEINHLWETSIKQLEDEISSRESKLIQFEEQKKLLKRILKNSGISSSGTITPNSSNNKGMTLSGSIMGLSNLKLDDNDTKEIENIFKDEDSDDEFFDADEYDDVKSLRSDEPVQYRSTNANDAADQNFVASAAGFTGAFNGVGPTEDVSKQLTKEVSAPSRNEAPLDSIKEHEIVQEPQQVPRKEEEEEEEETQRGHVDVNDLNDLQASRNELLVNDGSFLGYESPIRTRLAMNEDDRPKVGLWSILKSMIGKDMTRMTLPVSFNECTSLLQRLAEDIEYSELLQEAASIDDSTLRMVYVATFAASEYASTINRIAKPFNPLLGETYEYVRPDKNYRLLVEQVSHHPPISAARAESAKWDYYGENAVDSQFRGRSFDFKHLGKMFCNIRPDNGLVNLKGERVAQETYSWKKVNTAVVGIIIGNPVVDNYGKMEVTNHMTGDKIIVDMKQRGWRASSAYEIKGTVVDSEGKEHWLMGGRWDSKIFAKKIVANTDIEGRRNSLVNSTSATNKDPYNGHKFLIWQVNPRPKIPFNLTQFAVSLNAIDGNLKKYLPPTDTRLRPDQRAMEDGRYDEAADEKHRVEEKQRAARKERDLKKTTYKPNWFVKKKHPITGDPFWDFTGEYWKLRKDQKLKDCGDIF